MSFSVFPMLKLDLIKTLLLLHNNLIFLLLCSTSIGLMFHYFVIESLLKPASTGIRRSWIKVTDVIVRMLSFSFKVNKKIYALLVYIGRQQLRNHKLIYAYLFSIGFVLVTRTIWNYIIPKTGFDLLSTLAMFLSIINFTKIRSHHYLEEAFSFSYFPIGVRKQRFINDIVGFINLSLIWIFLLIDFSMTYQFSFKDLLECTVLFICYYLISLLFSVPKKYRWETKIEHKAKSKQEFKITLLFIICEVISSFILQPLVVLNVNLFMFIIPVLSICVFTNVFRKS